MILPELNLPRKRISRNLMQLMVRKAKQPVKVIEGGRGVGKSTVLADEMIDVVHDMPRSTNFLQAATYQQALTRTLPSTIQSLESLGYKKDLHFFVCKKPPAKWRWPEAYEPPLDYGRAIYWYNGATYLILSQDVNSRGLNTASGMADEFALLDPIKFQSETLATVRGQKARFEKCRRYRNQTYTSSIPRTQTGKFMYKYQEEALLHPEEIIYIRASSHINAENLPAGWFADQKRIMSPYEYAIEIDNKRPRALKGGFYPLFSDKDVVYGGHTYTAYNNDYLEGIVDKNGYNLLDFKHLDCRQDGDHIPGLPMDIALDYGKFNCIVTAQETLNTCKFISAFSVDSPKLTEDLVNQWCDYYTWSTCRDVFYWYDQTAMGRGGNIPKTYAEIVKDTLTKRGWNVIPKYYGAAPFHVDKYNFWAVAMRNNHSNLPRFCWNKHNCKFGIESMSNAEAREGGHGIEKVKTDEKKDHLDQRYTTHISDAIDMLAYFKYGHLLKASVWMPPTQMR
jgi:hypothetical protein